MHDYDTALKTLLKSPGCTLLRQISGVEIAAWLNVELPRVQNLRVDLLGVTRDGNLVHIELQGTNDSDMPLRMAEYYIHIYRLHRRAARQIVLYVGNAPLKMSNVFPEPGFPFSYSLVDIRELDGAPLLVSPHIEDNLLAILARLQNERDAIRQILARIGELKDPERSLAFNQILIISGLRKLAHTIEEEAHKMPVTIDLREHDLFGPVIEQGIQIGKQAGLLEGRQEGKLEGKLEGRREGALTILRRLIEKRFGALPAGVERQLNSLTEAELDSLSLRLLDANSIEELFGS
jgi:predicted transposase YdaD